MNEPIKIGKYAGYEMVAEGISYCCHALKLRGYRDDLALLRAMKSEIKKRKTKKGICSERGCELPATVGTQCALHPISGALKPEFYA